MEKGRKGIFEKGVKIMKKIIAFATAASLMLGSMGVTAYGASFADIDTVTWSGFKPFLNQAAELGLMSGYEENGKRYCKPRNNVTYCEAVQLMYSIMNVYTKQDVNDATVTKWKPVISAYNIPEWAYKATAYGLENSILTTAELNKLQGGTKYANREDVGVIFGKALDTVNGYDIKSGASLSYNDASQVSAAAVPYLDLLNRANLMVGDSDNKFNPKKNITRAEMAVLSVKSYNKLTETKADTPVVKKESTVVGTVTDSRVMQNGDLFLTMRTNSGTTLSLFGTKGSVTAKYDGEKISFDDIGTGDTVKVTYEGQYMSAIEVTYSKAGIQKITEETYELVDLTDTRITVKNGSSEDEFRLVNGVEVELEGKKSSVSKLQNAMEDMKYDVTLTLNEDERVIKIKAVKNANNPTEGYLTDLTNSKITIKAGSREYEYPLTDGDISIKKDGKTMTFSKLKSSYDEYNYTVSLKLNSKNEVTGITIKDQEDETKGTLIYMNIRSIKIEAAGEEYSYRVDADDVDVVIDGKKSSYTALKRAFNEDEKAFTVELDVDRDDYVTEIIAKSKNAEGSEGKVTKVTNSEITIQSGSKEITYKFASDVDIKINGKSREIADLKNNYDTYVFEAELEFNSSNRVSKVKAEIKEVEEGVLKDINEDKETITVSAGSIDVVLDLASSVKLTLDGDSITLRKLNNELDYADSENKITVELTYNSSNKVTKVEAAWEEEKPDKGDLYKVYPDDDEIIIKDNDGKKYTYDVKSSVTVSYSFSANVNERWYDKPEDYASSLKGLKKFFGHCDDNNDDCFVTLTVNDGVVTRIRARAE